MNEEFSKEWEVVTNVSTMLNNIILLFSWYYNSVKCLQCLRSVQVSAKCLQCLRVPAVHICYGALCYGLRGQQNGYLETRYMYVHVSLVPGSPLHVQLLRVAAFAKVNDQCLLAKGREPGDEAMYVVCVMCAAL